MVSIFWVHRIKFLFPFSDFHFFFFIYFLKLFLIIKRNIAFWLQSVTLHTNLGDIKCEIFCDEVPKTAEVSSVPITSSRILYIYFPCLVSENLVLFVFSIRHRFSRLNFSFIRHFYAPNNIILYTARILFCEVNFY